VPYRLEVLPTRKRPIDGRGKFFDSFHHSARLLHGRQLIELRAQVLNRRWFDFSHAASRAKGLAPAPAARMRAERQRRSSRACIRPERTLGRAADELHSKQPLGVGGAMLSPTFALIEDLARAACRLDERVAYATRTIDVLVSSAGCAPRICHLRAECI
jgi:hypothetical protein